LFPLFATSVVYTGGKFAVGVVNSGGNLPPVSTALARLVEKLPLVSLIPVCRGVVDTGGNFAAVVLDSGAIDTSGAP
jgi:hypothetical protein